MRASGILFATATAVKSGSTVAASVNGIVVTVQVARDLAVASGDVLIVAQNGGQWVVIQRLFTAAPPASDPPAPPPPTGGTSGTLVVRPVETRSYRNGAWRTDNSDVYQGQWGGAGNHTGCAFYGTTPRSLSGASVTAARIQVQRKTSGGITAAQPTTMLLVAESTRPGSAPTLGASSSGPSLAWGGTNGAFAIPTSWAQSMVDGTAGGLGFFVSGGTPYVILNGLGSWAPAFTMSIDWSR